MGVKALAIVTVGFLAVAPSGWAQEVREPVSRADLSATLGWLNANKAEIDTYRGSNDWYNWSLLGSVSAGWYWTDHWKTEIEGGVSTSAELNTYSPTPIGGRTVYSTYEFVTRRLAIGQQYQFERNAWVHPFVGIGVDLTWEQIDRRDDIYSYPPLPTATPQPRRTELLTRPFATFGLKAYMTPRAFFRTDLKVVYDKGIDEVLVRVGVGVDF